MKTIISATDFSATAQNVAEYAADMALSIHADLLLVHIFQIPVAYSEIIVAAAEGEMMNDAKESLSSLKEQLIIRTGGKLNINTEFSVGFFFQELKEICEKIQPYTVVMGSQGSTATERVLYGGHTVYAMKNLQWPLITVPPGAAFSQVKKICVACDFEKVTELIPVDEIKELVNDFDAELYIVYSGDQELHQPELIFESGLLQEMLMSLKPQYHFVVNENRDEGIFNFVEKNNIDLLITLPKNYGLLKKIIHKSFSKRLILHSQVPVLAMHIIPG